MKGQRHHLVLLAAVAGLLGVTVAIVVRLNQPLDPQVKAIETNELQIYLELAALVVPALSAVGLWWWKQHLTIREQVPPREPAPRPVPRPRVRPGPRPGWPRRIGRQALAPATIVIAAGTGLGVDLVMSLFGRTPPQAALTALGTAVAAYVVVTAIGTAGADPEAETPPAPDPVVPPGRER